MGRGARWRAGAAHLVLSVLVAVAAFVAAFTLWYPGALFAHAGGLQLSLLVAGVDVTLGPLLTTIVFKPGKKGLKFDLAVIGTLQAVALAYGLNVLFEARPAYIAFVKDRFELVRADDIPAEELARGGSYASLPMTGPRFVGVRFPTEPDEKFRIMMSGIAGLDIQYFPKYYVPYENARADVASHVQPIARLRELNPSAASTIDGIVAASGQPEQALGFVPMRAGPRDLTVVVDAKRADIIQIAALLPWKL
ncbi:MAG: TfpX/TfpZ family type IV pilin accessory protein [Betaproteobacteria bacterium]